jgi:hypothetical protein
MEMMYRVIAREIQDVGIRDKRPQDYLNFYCLGNREEVDSGGGGDDGQSDNASPFQVREPHQSRIRRRALPLHRPGGGHGCPLAVSHARGHAGGVRGSCAAPLPGQCAQAGRRQAWLLRQLHHFWAGRANGDINDVVKLIKRAKKSTASQFVD